MVHDPVEQGDDKYNSFLSSMFVLRADASGTYRNVNFIIVLFKKIFSHGIYGS